MRVRLLGPIDVADDCRSMPVTGLRRQAVLAVLGLHPGQVVSSDRLIDIVWGDRAPVTAQNTLQRHVSHLRSILGVRACIVARPPGYLLDLGPEATDVQAAERLIAESRRCADPGERADRLRAALALWRGRPLAGVTGLPWFDEQADRLVRAEQDAARALADARMAMGEHAGVIGELERLAELRQFDEELHGQLMIALYRSGRQADALATYQRLRHTLAAELGIDPGQAVREVEAAILRQDPALDRPAPAGSVTSAGAPVTGRLPGPVPAQLPLATAMFAARDRELADLDARLAGADRSGATLTVTIAGTAGVGKSTLAVTWAHRVRHRFPDGQLYVNLRGFDPGGVVVDPGSALRGFLDAYGVPAGRVPTDLDATAALYRSVLAGRRVLVLLDNARDAEQVRPLLPGTPGCLVVVTSRNQLTPLVTVEGAHPVTLDLLTEVDARRMLVARLGADRVAAEPLAVEEIIARCARLPLALAVAAAGCAIRPALSVTSVAAQLRASASALDALDGTAPGTDIRAVFSWSYRAVTAAAARMFRLLGTHPGPDVSLPAAASLAGVDAAEVAPLLTELTAAHLLVTHTPGRYTLHDLLRAYAADQATRQGDPEPARRRLLDHYLHSARAAAALCNPQRNLAPVPAPLARVTPERPVDAERAAAWYAAELPVLLACVRLAGATGHDGHVWRLAAAMQDHLDRRGYWDEQAANQRAAITAADRAGDLAARAHAHCTLATAMARTHRYAEADDQLGQALDLYLRLSDLAGQATIRYQLGWLTNRRGRPAEAMGHTRAALRLYRACGDQIGAARALNSLGWGHASRGDFARAQYRCEVAVAQLRRLGDRHFEAGAEDSLGYIHHHLGDHARAVGHFQRALELFRAVGNRYNEADTLDHLGDTHAAAGQPVAAAAAWRRAVEILDELGNRDVAGVRSKLDDVADRRLPGGQV